MFAEDYFEGGAPAFVDGDEVPGDTRGEVAEDDLGGGVDLQGGSYEVEARVFGGEVEGGEVAVALELCEGVCVRWLAVMEADAQPVIEALKG